MCEKTIHFKQEHQGFSYRAFVASNQGSQPTSSALSINLAEEEKAFRAAV
jgi:hypothetical protein